MSLESTKNWGVFGLWIVVILTVWLMPDADLMDWVYAVVFCLIVSVFVGFLFVETPAAQTRNTKEALKLHFGEGQSLYINKPFEHVLVVGGSGSGKTESVIKPLLYAALNNRFGGLIYDYKSPVLLDFVYDVLEEYKIKMPVLSLNFLDPSKSGRINIMSAINTPTEATELANNLLSIESSSKDFFSLAASKYLAALLYHFRDKSLPFILAVIMSRTVQEVITACASDNFQTKIMLKPVIDSLDSAKQLAGITAELANKLMPFMADGLFWILSGDQDLILNEPDNPKILVLGNDPNSEESLSPVITGIISLMMRGLNQKNKHPSMFVIDGLSTLQIPKLDRFLSVVRSNSVSSILAYQDNSQLETNYTKAKANAITANCGYKFYGKNTNADTITEIQKILGEHESTVTLKGSSSVDHKFFAGSTSTSQTILKRQNVHQEDMMSLSPGQFFGIIPENLKDGKRWSSFHFDAFPKIPLADHRYKTVLLEEIQENYSRILDDANRAVDVAIQGETDDDSSD